MKQHLFSRTHWVKDLFKYWTTVRARTPEQQRRGSLLAMFILIIIAVNIALLLLNVWNWLVNGDLEARGFALLGLIEMGMFAGMWRLNRGGHTTLIAHLFLSLIIVAISTLSESGFIRVGYVSYVIPIIMAGFVLPPQWSFAYAALAALGFALRLEFVNAAIPFPEFEIAILLILSATTYLIASRYVGALKTAEESEAKVRALYETTRDLVIERDLSKLLHTVVERAARLLDATGGGLYLCEPQNGQVRCVVSYNTPRDYTGMVLKYGEGAAGKVAETGEPFIIEDYPTWEGRAAVYEEEIKPFQAVLSVPIKWQDEIIGVLHVLEFGRQRRFTENDLELVMSFANQAASAVQNARLYTQAQQELDERKQAESRLIESRAQLSGIIESAMDGIITVDSDQRILLFNTASEKMFGCSAADAIGQSIDRFIPARFREAHREHIRRFGQKGETSRAMGLLSDLMGLRANGEEFPIEASISQIEVNGQKLYTVIHRDITERKRAEESLQIAESEYRAIFENSPVGIFRSTPDGRFLNVNREMAHIYGYDTPEEMMTSITDIASQIYVDPGMRHKLQRPLAEHGEVAEFSEENYRKDGSRIWTMTKSRTVKDAEGNTQHFEGFIIDITERKQAEEEHARLYKSERNAHQITETLRAANLALTRDLSLNTVLETFLDYLQQLVPYDSANVMILEGDTRLAVRAIRGYEDFTDSTQIQSIAFNVHNHPVFSPMLDQQQSLVIPDTREYPGWERPAGGEHVISWMGVPLVAGGRTMGIYSMDKTTAGFFTEEHRKLAEALTAQAAVAIKNAQLFEQIQEELTQRKQADEKIRHLTRLYATLSQVNQTIVRVKDREELFKSICRVAVEFGQFRMAWIGLVNEETGDVKPAASEGYEQGYLQSISITTKDLTAGPGPTGSAIRNGRLIAISDIETDAAMRPRRAAALQRGYRSVAAVPFRLKGRVIGALTLYATEPGFFSEEEQRLLEEIGLDISFALDSMDVEAERQRAEEMLQESESRYRMLFESNPHPMWVYDLETLAFLTVNEAAIAHYGYSRQEFMNMTIKDIRPPESIPALMDNLASSTETLQWSGPWKHRKKDGKLIEVEILSHEFLFGERRARLVLSNDITERKQAEEKIQAQAKQMTALYETTRDLGTQWDLPDLLETIVTRAMELLNTPGGGLYLYDAARGDLYAAVDKGPGNIPGIRIQLGEGLVGRVAQTRQPMTVDDYQTWGGRSSQYAHVPLKAIIEVPLLYSGELIGVLVLSEVGESGRKFTEADVRLLSLFAGQAASAVNNTRLFEEEQRLHREASVIAEVGRDISASLQLDVVLEKIAAYTQDLLGAETSAVYLAEPATRTLRAVAAVGSDAEEIKHDTLQIGEGILGNIALQKTGEIVYDTATDSRAITIKGTEITPLEHLIGVPVLSKDQLIGLIAVWRVGTGQEFKLTELDFLGSLAGQVAVAIENARLFEETQKHLSEAQAIGQVSAVLSQTLELEPMLENILQAAIHAIPAAKRGSVLLADEEENLHIRAVQGYTDPRVRDFSFPINSGYSSLSFHERRGILIPDVRADPRIRYDGDIPEMLTGGSAIAAPLIVKDRPIGVIAIDTSARQDAFNESDLYLLTTISAPAALAIENARLFENTRRRLAEIEAVHTVSTALRSTQTLEEALPIILDQLMDLLNSGGASLEMVDPVTEEIVTELAYGAWARVTNLRTPPGSGVSGKVIATGQPYVSADVIADGKTVRPDLFGSLNAVACVPVITQHQPIGALWVGRQTPFLNEEVSLLAAIGEMTGNAIHRMRLHEQTELLLADLQVANRELSVAYDTTLEGWAKALELRDKETEGHSRRVTDLTLRLARRMDVSEPELIDIRRGVLLHDIGKMGVTDQLLKKTGPLTDDEWLEMRKHPKYAYDLLRPIPFLRRALDIPYCHHEKWDGSGYPRGLKGKQIPLAARIFAIVDVWDALSYDRPYRKAWPRRKVMSYLREQSGIHFDPQVADAFLNLLQDKRLVSREHDKPK